MISGKNKPKNKKRYLQSLGPALLDIKKMCYQLTETGLFHIQAKYTYTLAEFQDFQFTQLEEVVVHSYVYLFLFVCFFLLFMYEPPSLTVVVSLGKTLHPKLLQVE